jgi:hypothetical protein
MTTPRWGHKPPPVPDRYTHWSNAPAEPSERMAYWVRRWRAGEWEPNRRLLQECPDCRAGMLGVWMWEARFVLHPLTELRDGRPPQEIASWVADWSDELPGPYWTLLELRARYRQSDPDEEADWREDLLGGLTQAMESARVPATPNPWRRR